MNSTRIGNLSLAPGQRPKIIVPIACASPEEAVDAARAIGASSADMAELRVDVLSETDLPALLDEIRNALAGKPLLFTFRTAAEGGSEVSPEHYLSLIQTAAGHDGVDAIDIELASPVFDEAMKIAGSKPVVASFHDFSATPSNKEMEAKLRKMKEAGAQIAKIAVTANSPVDVARLLEVTARCAKDFCVLTIAMGKDGAVSRICGQAFGSVATFATIRDSSAPGQLSLEDTQAGLDKFDY
ncbi:type I 3-dehydroquinate dehydratase [Propionimicrobium lymphophilum]|uniref:type I 3-dehydroquinate dehydratase n=1 Tax=Propionimicrobium lymphophilum TaxID=33012 RepID=UPI00254FE791|nr:type I 3-dehydroquinate dehydratase [Propionimicrobium lymphophilum]MDK7709437.1 type I 3-dehydroquinate dehydratase [Propionimicrobium lymphophilum]MDK7733423.1 type I 3-dehydroquinate dehydratase [Propionimicrobium lymphophilum]